MENGMYMIHMMPHLILDFRMMMFEDVHGQSICHIPAKRMLEQLQDNKGANLTISKRRISPFANTLRLNPRLAPEELSVSQRHEANFAWHLWHVMVQGPQHCLNLVDFGSGILRLAKGSNGCKARKALGDAPSSLSIVGRQCVE